MKEYNVGLVGFGYWGRILIKYLRNHQNFNLKSIAVRQPEKITSEIPEGIHISSVKEMSEDKSIDAVFIATPIQNHYETAKIFINQGKHVFCEKPLTAFAHHAQELKELSQKTGRTVFTDYIYTFSPSLLKMANLAHSGEIGNIQSIIFNIRQLGHFSENSVYIDLGCHCLAFLDLIFPLEDCDKNHKEADSRGWLFNKSDIIVRDGITETGEISFTYGSKGNNDIHGRIFLSFNHPQKTRNISIYGETGTIIYDISKEPPLQMETYRSDRSISRDPIERKLTVFNYDETNNIAHAIDNFHRTLRGEIPSNLNRAVKVTEILHSLGICS